MAIGTNPLQKGRLCGFRHRPEGDDLEGAICSGTKELIKSTIQAKGAYFKGV
ncbi:hypothetical protein HHE06_11880 [Helicobacter heilmannii]|nr:hypothetical protein HHE06_11880 [Helicobacter heilmannii]